MTERETQKAIKEQIARREDISPLIDAFRNGTFSPTHSKEELMAFTPGHPDTDALWEGELKRERFAIETLFISELWPKYVSYRAAHEDSFYSNVTALKDSSKLLLELQKASYTIFESVLDAWVSQYERQSASTLHTSGPLDAAYDRLKTITEFGAKHFYIGANQAPSVLISEGFNTGINVTWSLLELATSLAKREGVVLTDEETIRAVKGAYGPIIAMSMNMNDEVSTRMLGQMMVLPEGAQEPHFIEEYFDLKKNKKGEYVIVPNTEKMHAITNPLTGQAYLDTTPGSATIGCPAALNRTMEAYFDLSMEDAKKYYFPKVSTP